MTSNGESILTIFHMNQIIPLVFSEGILYAPTTAKIANLYMSLVHSTMKYSVTIWDPYHQKDIDKLCKIKKMAARFIANYYRYI